MRIHGLILAAGDSSRLGQPKQLIRHQGQSLLRHVESQLLSCVDALWAVLGFEHHTMQTELQHSNTLINPNWATGMGSSLALGSLTAGQHAEGLLVALCDQPLIPAEHYQKLVQQFRQLPQHIINTQYAATHGVPAIFPQSCYPELHKLRGPHGAQHLFKNPLYKNQSVSCDAAGFDLDTPADLTQLISD